MFAAENDEIVPVPGRTYSESLESGSRGLYKGFYNSGTERVPSGVSLTSEAFDCRKLDYVYPEYSLRIAKIRFMLSVYCALATFPLAMMTADDEDKYEEEEDDEIW